MPLVKSASGELVPPAFELQLYDPVEGKHAFIGCLGYEPEESLVFIGNKSGAFRAEKGETSLDAKLFIDKGIVELFINGRWALTNEIPIAPETKLVLVAKGVDGTPIEFVDVDCWAMASIWG